MATFVISSISSTVSSSMNSVRNMISDHPFHSFFDDSDVRWRKDRLSPRLNDLTIQKSAYNEIIPTIYGTVRLAGNIIWGMDIREEVRHFVASSGGGKGAPKVYQNNYMYYYYANIAIGICVGEVTELKSVWADTELLDMTKYKYRFYRGSESQGCDPLIQSVQGVGNTPAYRGLCYIVFEDFPLGDFGNRIPNFTFEIARNLDMESRVENTIAAVNIIPGAGEFVYEPQLHYKYEGNYVGDFWFSYGKKSRINQNNNSDRTDAVLGIEQLQQTLPNCKWVSPVVSWFGSSLDIDKCKIIPKCEYKHNMSDDVELTTPTVWSVAGKGRADAELVGRDGDRIRYGGTPADGSVVRYLEELKSRGLSIMFYPMMFMDMPDKPWRGYLSGSADDVKNFFMKKEGYNDFILHYAKLVGGYVDAFLIGSELRGLTAIRADDDSFPAVECLIDLAKKVREILPANVKISYAADWSEYHHCEGGWYNLDALWASENIDFVGIDAYFPLTDKRQNLITKKDILEGWDSGECYDWYYADGARSERLPLDPPYALKNIDWWWNNVHVNPDGQQTEWTPRSKKIWFTEYGFASVDGTTNEPNKFYSKDSIDGGFPRHSEGLVDYNAQRMALEATEERWVNSEMVENKFVWCWDARPFPFFPNYTSVWSDGYAQRYGHWINGKLGGVSASMVLRQIFRDFAVDEDLIGNIDVEETMDGLALNNKMKLSDVLSIMQKAYFFDFVERDGRINLLSKNTESVIVIPEGDLLSLGRKDGRDVFFQTTISGSDQLPQRLDVSFINRDYNYQSGSAYGEKTSIGHRFGDVESLPIVMTQQRARQVAEINLFSLWTERITYNFALPIKYLFLEVGDVITVAVDGLSANMRIKSIGLGDNNHISLNCVRSDVGIYKIKPREDEFYNTIPHLERTGQTQLDILELPALDGGMLEKPILHMVVNGEEEGWRGCTVHASRNSGGSYEQVGECLENSVVGCCCTVLGFGRPYYFDLDSELLVYFDSRMNTDSIDSVSNEDLVNGKNIAMVGNEILQYKNIEPLGDGIYRMGGLLRGQFGTEKYINNHTAGERFILLDGNLPRYQMDEGGIGVGIEFRAVSFGNEIGDSAPLSYVPTARNLRPLAPVHLSVRREESGLVFRWRRRGRGYGGWRDGVDLPLSEKRERYAYEIRDVNGVLKRSGVILDSFEFIYTSDAQMGDFSSSIAGAKFVVCQLSDAMGQGDAAELEFGNS